MCGIFGYLGPRSALTPILEGLGRLEYRGYDSAGIAVLDGDRLLVRRALGRVQNLLKEDTAALPGHAGIGHTRWATHGEPAVRNAHPHVDCAGDIAVVHNGIIENHAELRGWLLARGHVFRSETDTEVVPHLVEEHAGAGIETAIRKAVELLRGDFALAILARNAPGIIAAARRGNPPLLVGLADGEQFLASDALALVRHTKHLIAIEDGEVVLLTTRGLDGDVHAVYGGAAHGSARGHSSNGRPTRATIAVDWTTEDAEQGGHAHFMHKEIHEQPAAIRRTLTDRVSAETGNLRLDSLRLTAQQWREIRRVTLIGCGTSYHAGLIGRWFLEGLARIPTDVDMSSEFRHRDPLIGPGDLAIFISQSGETADTLGAVRVAKARGARVLGICNVPGSSLTRAADGVVMTSTGPEVGVASTKSFTAQVAALFMVALLAGRSKGVVDAEHARVLLHDLAAVPAGMQALLQDEERVLALASLYQNCRDVFFLGRGLHYPVALEGALKLKEIAYVRAEAFPAGEMKHGPLALVDDSTLTIAIAPAGPTHAKMLATIEEVKARRGTVVALCTKGDTTIPPLVDATLEIPAAAEYLLPCLAAIPLQLFAYHMAVLRGCDVDRPRNLAKSVTVE